MASIVKRNREKGLAYFVVYRFDGKQLWKYAGKRRGDAERLKAKIEHELHTGVHRELAEVTFVELAQKWLEIKKGQVRPKTHASYEPHVRRLVAVFGGYRVKNISQEAIERFVLDLTADGVAPATISRSLTLLGSIFRKGIQWGYLARNPAEFVAKPKVPKAKIDLLEPEEIKLLVDAADPRHRCLLLFACLTGCRQSEILGLRWSDVDFANGRVFIRQTLQGNQFFEPKTESSRRAIDFPPVLGEELKAHQIRQAVELPENPHDLVFTSSKGTPLKSRNVTQRILEQSLRLAGLRKVGFHSLRHSYVSMLIAQGENVKTIQALVGHADTRTTWNTYGHLFSGATKEAVLRLESSLFGEDHVHLAPQKGGAADLGTVQSF